MQLAAIWHWYLLLSIYILCLSIPFLYFSLTWFKLDGIVIDTSIPVLALCALLTGVILKGLTLWKFVSDVCGCMF